MVKFLEVQNSNDFNESEKENQKFQFLVKKVKNNEAKSLLEEDNDAKKQRLEKVFENNKDFVEVKEIKFI